MTLSPKEEAALKLIGEDISYENYFFNKVSDIKWFYPLKEKGYFAPEKSPEPKPADQEGYFTIPQWNVLPYLEKISQQVNMPTNEKYINGLLSIIQDVTEYHIKHNKILDNYRTWWYFIKILCNLPTDNINDEILNLIPIWLESKFNTMLLSGSEVVEKLLPKFLDSDKPEDLQKSEKIAEYSLTIKPFPSKGEGKILKTVIEPYYLKKSFIEKTNATKLGKICSNGFISNLSGNIKKILKNNDDGTYFSFYSKQHFEHDALDLLTEILKNIFLSKSKINVKETIEVLKKYFTDDYLYFTKMALYIIGNDEENVKKYKDIYFEYLKADEKGILMNGLYFGDEIKHLFNNLKDPTDTEKNLLTERIENDPNHTADKKEKTNIDIWKQERYEALKHIPEFEKKWNELKQKNRNIDYKLKPAIGESQAGWIEDTSPIDYEEISQMSVREVVDFIKSYKPPTEKQDFFKNEEVAGLSMEISKAVQKDPKKFIDELNLFMDVGYYYIYSLIDNFRKLWENKSTIDVEKVLSFIKEYIKPNKFWNDEMVIPKDDLKANHKLVIGIIGEFIQAGTRDDSWAFDEKHLPLVKDILFSIVNKLEKSEPRKDNDPVLNALNTHQGKIIDAFINYTLRVARLKQKTDGKEDVNWEKDIKAKYEYLLNKDFSEAYTLLGKFLPQFSYLDNKWVQEKINILEKLQKEDVWEIFMTGYLYSSKVYNEIFNLMEKHYLKALNYSFKNEHAKNAVVQHIAIGYLRNLKKDNTTYNKLLEKWDSEQIKELISFFWMQRRDKEQPIEDEERTRIENKIIDFWQWIYENKYKGKQEHEISSEDKKILSELCNLSVFLPEINSENFEWLKISALFVDTNFHSSFFIEYLDELKDKKQSVDFVREVYLEMLKNATPDFRKEDIQSIVEFLYQRNKKTEADEICNIYDSRGYEFLRELYNQHNQAY